MMRSLPEWQKPVWHSKESVQMSGSVMESSLTPSLKSTRLWYCQPSCMHSIPVSCKETYHFHLSCLSKLLKIKWQDKLSDTEVLKKAGMRSMQLAQLRWIGHVLRLPDNRLQKKVFYGELQEGKRSQSGQKKTLQRHPQSLSEGFRHTNRVFGTDCTGAIKVVRSHQQRSSSL